MDRDEEIGCRPIGSLVPKIVSSLKTAGLSQMPSRMNSATTGLPCRERPVANSTGRQLSEIAAATLPSIASAMDMADPERLDRAIAASLPPSIKSILAPIFQDRIDPVYGFDTEIVGYARRPAQGCPERELQAARQLVGRYLAPAAESRIKMELARLRVSTKARAESDGDLAMMFQVFAEECAEYPADVVVWALRGWARTEIFYPSLAELRERLQRGARRRRSLMAVINGPCNVAV